MLDAMMKMKLQGLAIDQLRGSGCDDLVEGKEGKGRRGERDATTRVRVTAFARPKIYLNYVYHKVVNLQASSFLPNERPNSILIYTLSHLEHFIGTQ